MEDDVQITEEEVSDLSEIEDDAEVKVSKGPDPEVWGDPEDRYQADVEAGKITEEDVINDLIQEKLDAGEEPIVEVDGVLIKGPDPAVWSVPDDDPEEEIDL